MCAMTVFGDDRSNKTLPGLYLFTGLDSSKEDWDRVLGVNVIGYSNMVQACHPFMTKGNLLASCL